MSIVTVLLVEDNPDDISLTRDAFQDAGIEVDLQVVEDGDQAISFLRQDGRFESAPRPHIVLLDLNLPRCGGHEVLQTIKHDADLRRIPVIILTNSRSDDDIAHAYDNFCNSYITKPVDFDEFLDVLRSLEDFWLNVVELPRH